MQLKRLFKPSTHGLLKLSLHLMTIIQNTWAGTWGRAINLSSSESKLLNFLFMSSSCEEMENLSRLWMRERKLLKGRARMLPETEKWAKMGVEGRKRNSLISSQHSVNMGSTKAIHPKCSRWVRENHRPQWSKTFRISVPDPETAIRKPDTRVGSVLLCTSFQQVPPSYCQQQSLLPRPPQQSNPAPEKIHQASAVWVLRRMASLQYPRVNERKKWTGASCC